MEHPSEFGAAAIPKLKDRALAKSHRFGSNTLFFG